MFKKTKRLTQSEFSEYFKIGKRHNSPAFTIVTHPLPSLKVSVVVGKKVAKSAVKRNLIKRRVYASLRRELVGSEFSGVLIVLIKPSYNDFNRKTADAALLQAFAQVVKNT